MRLYFKKIDIQIENLIATEEKRNRLLRNLDNSRNHRHHYSEYYNGYNYYPYYGPDIPAKLIYSISKTLEETMENKMTQIKKQIEDNNENFKKELLTAKKETEEEIRKRITLEEKLKKLKEENDKKKKAEERYEEIFSKLEKNQEIRKAGYTKNPFMSQIETISSIDESFISVKNPEKYKANDMTYLPEVTQRPNKEPRVSKLNLLNCKRLEYLKGVTLKTQFEDLKSIDTKLLESFSKPKKDFTKRMKKKNKIST